MINGNNDFNEYLQWASSSLDIKYNNSIKIRDYDNDNDIERGIMNTSIIPKQTILFSVPLTSLLSIQSIALNASILLPLIHLIKEDDVLSLFLIYEKFKGKESKWYKHIDILPKYYDSLPNFNQLELEELKGFYRCYYY
jgi:SET domain-containing protein 6